MFYRPAFCCNCGEKIQREEWRLWTSRRFCALCETEHKGIDLIPRAVVLIGLVLTVFGFGSYFRRSDVPAQDPQLIRSARPVANLKPAAVSLGTNGDAVDSNSRAVVSNSGLPGNQQISEQPKRERTTSEESVYYCGAITKKGTPCTRRVKTKGSFCWQHARSGQVAPARV